MQLVSLNPYPCHVSRKKESIICKIFFFLIIEPGSTPRNLSARPLSASTMVIQWDEPQELSGLVTVISHLVF